MSEQKDTKILLLEEFFAFQDTMDAAKILRLKKKIQKFLRSTYDNNTQLLDAVRILDLWVDNLEYNDFEYSYRIASPIAERLACMKTLDLCDIMLSIQVVGYRKDYNEVHEFAQKILAALEDYKSDKRYRGIKIVTYMNVLLRLLRVKYFELDSSENTAELAELTALFMKYVHLVLELCGDQESLWLYKTMALLRKAIFEKDYEEIDAKLVFIREKGNAALCRVIIEEVNGFSSFAGGNITKTQLNLQVGANIRKIRRARYMSLETLGEGVGISYASLQAIEQGNISLTVFNLHKLAQFFEMSTDEILYGKNDAKDKDEVSGEIKELLAYTQRLSKTEIDVLNNVAKQMSKTGS